MSTFNSYQAGLHNVGSFQVSSSPYATASLNINPGPDFAGDPVVLRLDFDRVSKFIIVKNEISVDFAADYKVTQIYLMAHPAVSSSASVHAGMTGIHKNQLEHNWSGSLGVG